MQLSHEKIFFEPIKCEENNKFGASLRKYQVAIDMGDVISCNRRQLLNDSGRYISDPSQAKNYMYDYFLQINLTQVNSPEPVQPVKPAEEESKEKTTKHESAQLLVTSHFSSASQI